MTTIDLAAMPPERLEGTLAALDRAKARFLSDGNAADAGICDELTLQVQVELATRAEAAELAGIYFFGRAA